MADEGTYELEPEDGPKPGAPGAEPPAGGGGASMGSARAGKPGSIAPGAKIEAGGLLDDFDEDADFSDPGPAAGAVSVPSATVRSGVPDPATLLPPIVTDASVLPLIGSPKVLGVLGGVLLVIAVVITGLTTASARPLIPPLITLYEGIVHTGTGVVAVLIAARFAERRANRLELVAARMLAVTALFLAFKNARFLFAWQVEELLLGAGAYCLGVLALFRLPRFETGLIAGSHFCLWVLMEIGRIMYGVVEAAGLRQPLAPTGQ